MKALPLWLIGLTVTCLFFIFGTQYAIDIRTITSLKVEVRGAAQCASTYAFSALSLESMGERKLAVDRAHRVIVLNKPLARQQFEASLRSNLKLNEAWQPVGSKYLRKDGVVVVKDVVIIDSNDLPYTYKTVTYTEPTIIVAMSLPVHLYSKKHQTLEVVRVIPFRTFITNWQKN